MHVIELNSCHKPGHDGAVALFYTAALLAPWLSFLSGMDSPLFLLVAALTTAAIFVLALNDDQTLYCRRLMVNHKGLLAVCQDGNWCHVSSCDLIRMLPYYIEISVKIEGSKGKKRLFLSRKNMSDVANYSIVRYYLLQANRQTEKRNDKGADCRL